MNWTLFWWCVLAAILVYACAYVWMRWDAREEIRSVPRKDHDEGGMESPEFLVAGGGVRR